MAECHKPLQIINKLAFNLCVSRRTWQSSNLFHTSLSLLTTIPCLVNCYIFANHAAVTHISSSFRSSMLKSCPQKIDRQISRHVRNKVKSIFSSLGFQVSGLKNAGDICSPATNFDFTLGTSSVRIIVYNWNATV